MTTSFDYGLLTAENESIGNENYRSVLYDLNLEKDKKAMSELLNSNKSIQVLDEIDSQLEELIKLRYPRNKFSKQELKNKVSDYLLKINKLDYGIWAYYPWSNKLIHILNKKEFIEVRTNRNHYKITREEEQLLSGKKIGVIGLSVGKAISLALALERVCGELVLADFDVLELSNLNRIQTGIQNFNIRKTLIVAREIAELDPYLKVTCYHDGLTEDNMDDFFTKNGKLDLCVEVCDGLSTKILAREKARSLSIPVVMDTSDRGMIDIERFDLEPERPVFHGLIEHLDINDIKKAKTNEEKIPFILPIIGVNNISSRLKASMMEVEESISTWPQLGSEVLMGGGITAGVCRRILLNQLTSSGRYYIDVDEIIKEEKVKEKLIDDKQYHAETVLTQEDLILQLDTYTKNINDDSRIFVEEPQIQRLVEAGISAPSGGNCQPWKWCYKDGVLGMFYDKSLNKSFLDYNHISAHLALGAAFQNIILKAHELQFRVKTKIHNSTSGLVATFLFYDWMTNVIDLEPIINSELSATIFKRCTNRLIDVRKSIAPAIYNQLHQVVENKSGVKLSICEDEKKLNSLEDIIGAADRLRLIHPAGYHDLFVNELRLDAKEANEKQDGVDIRTVDLTFGEITGIKLAKDPLAIGHLQDWDLGTGFEKISRKAVKSSSAIGVLSIPSYNKEDCLSGGQLMQTLWLKANSLNIGLHPLCVPIMFFARVTEGKGDGLSKEMITEVTAIRNKFLEIFPMGNEDKEVFMFRLCIAETPKIKSLRRPIEKVLNFG